MTVLDDGGPFAFSSDSRYLTYVSRDTKLSINLLKNAEKSQSIDSSSVLDLPATERPTDSQQDGNDLTHAGRDSEPDFFASPSPGSRRAECPAPQNDSRPPEKRRFSWLFKRNKRSPDVEAKERRSPELVFPARPKNPLVNAPFEISRQNMCQRVPSQAETSSADREGRKSDDGRSLGFCCFPAP